MLDVYKEAAAQKKTSKQTKADTKGKSTIFEIDSLDGDEEEKKD